MVTKFDVVIGGGGATGLTLALLLAKKSGGSLKIGIVDKSPKFGSAGPRTSAVALGPKNMLASIRAWSDEATFATPVRRIDVFDAKTVGEALMPDLTFQCADNEAAMAWIVRHSDLEVHLQTIARQESISFIEGEIVSCEVEGAWSAVNLQDGSTLLSRLVIGADGASSRLRELAKAPYVGWSYGRTAIVAILAHDEPHAGRAIQIFYPDGPFATLPLAGNSSSLVWTMATHRAELLARGAADELLVEVQQASANHLGRLALIDEVASFPLKYKHMRIFYGERLAFVGDAARSVHPLAGQGLNLGFRDVATLVECVIETARLGLDFGSNSALAEYSRRRNLDSVVSSSTFGVLHKIFGWDGGGLSNARKSGLSLVQKSDHLKRLLIREATGFAGNHPALFGISDANH